MFTGKIYRVNDGFIDNFVHRKKYEESGFDPKYDMAEEVADVECIWSQYLKIGGKMYWENGKSFPSKCINTDRKLPSDS